MTSDESTQNADANGAVAVDDLAGTIWPQVDRVLAGVEVRPEKGVLDVIVHVRRQDIVRSLRALKQSEELDFDYLRCITAVDNEDEGIDVVYHLYSLGNKHNLTVKATLPNDDLTIDTSTPVYKAANWLERETAEMFGVRFNGHPDPRTLLMPEDMDDTFPLRKTHPLAEIDILQGEGMGYSEEDVD
jgi:NADH:ubiquinone oxidoreductase subunit C